MTVWRYRGFIDRRMIRARRDAGPTNRSVVSSYEARRRSQYDPRFCGDTSATVPFVSYGGYEILERIVWMVY